MLERLRMSPGNIGLEVGERWCSRGGVFELFCFFLFPVNVMLAAFASQRFEELSLNTSTNILYFLKTIWVIDNI